MNETKSIMIVGVGGQGTLLSSRLIGSVLINAGYDIKLSEVHGMSQRGGSVVTYVKYGDRVYSPVIEKGEADYILAFEQLEAARYLPYLKKGGTMLVNTQQIAPMPVITGAEAYPEEIIHKIESLEISIIPFDALKIATEAGIPKGVNVAILGVLAKSMHFPLEAWYQAIKENVKEKFVDLNLNVFNTAYNL